VMIRPYKLQDPITRMQVTSFLTSIPPNINGAIKQHISWYAFQGP
jgi:hypothetical protein